MGQTSRAPLGRSICFVITAFLIIGSACARQSPARAGAIALLAATDTSVAWMADSAFVGDVDCDGHADSAFVGRSTREIHVGLVATASDSPSIVPFRIGGGSQDAVCEASAALSTETLDYDPTEDTGPLEGFKRSAVCKGLSLSDDSCDSIHLYWNHNAGKLQWWRR